jgi:hypothetical protein
MIDATTVCPDGMAAADGVAAWARYLAQSSRSAVAGIDATRSARGVAQPGSALAWGASGHRFKSGRPDQPDESSAARRQPQTKLDDKQLPS